MTRRRQPHAHPIRHETVDEFIRRGLRDPRLWFNAILVVATVWVLLALFLGADPR